MPFLRVFVEIKAIMLYNYIIMRKKKGSIIMDIVKIVFSPVGGTQRVTDILTDGLFGNKRKIDLTDANIDFSSVDIKKDEIAVMAVPSYGGRVPALAAKRLSQIKGNNARCVIVCVYGNRAYEDTLVELKDIAEGDGFNVIAAVSAVAEHSIIHQYAAGRPDDKDKAELGEFAAKISEKLKNGSTGISQAIPGNRPYKKQGAVTMVPKTNKKCDNCGLCADKCPAQAIKHGKNGETDGKKCIECMRCVEICPKSARSINKAMVSLAAMAIKKACEKRKDNELFI